MQSRKNFCYLPAVISAMVIAVTSCSIANADDTDAGYYLFSYFKGNGEDGLHFAASRDGLNWKSLNNDQSFTSPTVGGKLMRDPSIVQGPDGVFHMVWSSGWWDLGFGYAASKDLIHWSEHRFIPVNADVPGAKNTWAPDLFYDENSRQFVITFATTVPGRFPETDGDGDNNHRLYWVMTKDFTSFSQPSIAFDPGYNSIDGTILSLNGGLTMIYKDERPGHKQLHATTAKGLGQPWSPADKPILVRDWVEGPTVLKVGKVWRLYFDCYRDGHYAAAESEDSMHWKEITDQLQMPRGIRHGTAFRVTREIFESLQKLTDAGKVKN
jgi:hypothetical protein